ncbi:hypothetical protein [Dyadobacter sp. CY356]|uniref:hypothetical protein n=1 Tax=Dyadobacter sp. CY356 TaxID=2906442 RepID=UPI001F2BCAE3|nr:hypothetical protein [Dyadobacter sp. CY356]MCF0056741.1 hypothetical protein [Dyadobacter sp. CY356]
MKMIFVSNNWSDAHQQTRLKALAKLKVSILCIAVRREYYKVNSPYFPIIIGNVAHGRYTKRIGIYVRLLHQLSKNVVSKDCLYVLGFDLMMVSLIFRFFSGNKIKIIYEVPDVREMFFATSIRGNLIRWVERSAIPKIDLLVVTSPDFLTHYFVGLRKIPIQNSLIIENKIHPTDNENPHPELITEIPDLNRKIRIGYFGVLRCPASLDCLIKLSQNGKYEIILRGIFMPLTRHYEKAILDKKHMHYLGPYQAPQDLKFNYSTVDIVWAAYPFSDRAIGNHLYARTNRFYESLYFKKPFIVQEGTSDAKTAKMLGNIALEINLKNEEETIKFLCQNLTPDKLSILGKNMFTIPKEKYQITNEYNDLETWLQLNR